jgi:hypothetical protein
MNRTKIELLGGWTLSDIVIDYHRRFHPDPADIMPMVCQEDLCVAWRREQGMDTEKWMRG